MAADTTASEQPLYERPFLDPPDSVVSGGRFNFGCFNAPPARINMLDVDRPYHYRVPRWVKDFRCKEWRALQFGDSRYYFLASLYEAKAMGLVIFVAWDKEQSVAREFQRMIPLGRFGIGERLDGADISYKSPDCALRIATMPSKGEIRVEASAAERGGRPGFCGEFTFAYGPKTSCPISVCLPLSLNRAIYSTKVLMPMEGWFEADDERYEFAAADAMGVLDDHKGYYPYRMRYDWVSGFGVDGRGRRVGFNLTDNQVRDQVNYNENVLWINAKAYPLPPVKVTRPYGYEGEWHIQDTEGLVDLMFKPEKPNDIHVNALILAVDYHGPFGRFEGTIRSPDGSEKIDASSLYGMGEKKFIRV
ncbi:MAG TPA: DUF2804 domain-containing protein [Spirochaetales bacterium]|nr:DUF2804 domain-containing protein [Spirochaetales bacterium]HPE36983.1 DUF2804 domain-containing protein [Spirochaetales bacterium]